MNKKGFAATGILYTILVLFILLIFGMITMLYSRNNILNTIQGEVKGNLDIVYDVYSNGTAIYFNPVTGLLCDASEAVSTTGTKTGCMKWYIFNDNSTSGAVNAILDHNTTATVAWNSTGGNSDMKEVATQLASDTSTWISGLNSRLITADEIAQITGNTTFSQATSLNTEWFFLDSNDQTQTATTQGSSNYAWLFDYTNECTSYGCNVADSSNYGYWTSTPVVGSSGLAWGVFRSSRLFSQGSNYTGYGVRPVITISKYILKGQKYVVTNMFSNGSFEDGFTNWNSNLFGAGGGTLSTVKAYDGKQSVFINAIGDSKEKAIGYDGTISIQADHQYYFAMNVYVDSYTSSSGSPIASLINFESLSFDTSILNSWQHVSKIITSKGTSREFSSAGNMRFGQVYASSNYYQLYMDSIILVDLTEAFGSGNEPSQTWCDRNISWFEGSKNVYK